MKPLLLILTLYLPFSSSLFGKTVTLDGLIAYGLKHSTMIQKAQADIAQARAKQAKSSAERLGSIDLVGSYTHYNLPRTLAPMTPASISGGATAIPTTKNLATTGVAYSLPLFTGFAQTRQVEIEAIATAISQSKLALTKEQLAYNVASLYLSTLALQEMRQAQHRHTQALKRLTATIRQEVALGKKAQIDLLKAENDLYGSIAYEEVLEGNIAITKASLASLVGMKEVGALKPINVRITKPRYNIAQLLKKTQSLHKIQLSKLAIKRAKKQIAKSRASRYPQLSLNAYYGYNYGYNDSPNANPDDFNSEKSWQVGLNAKWNLVDFGKSSAATQQAKIAAIQAVLDKEQTLHDLRKSLIEAYEKMKQAYANYQSHTKQYALLQKSAKIEAVRYESGVSTINDLLYAKSQAHITRAKRIESRYNYKKAAFYMDYLLEKGVK